MYLPKIQKVIQEIHLKDAQEFAAQALGKSRLKDINKILTADDLAKGDDLAFTATGVIDGPMLKGVRFSANHCHTHSVVMRVKTGTVRFVETHHRLSS